MQFWGIFYPPPHVMLFYASFNIVGHADPNPPSPLRYDVIYGQPLIIWHCIIVEEYCWFVI